MKKTLLATPKLAVAVCRYAPRERHGRHTDTHSRISFVLRGGYREEGRPGVLRLSPGDVLLKSHRAEHEDEFSEDGAVLVALEFLRDDPFEEVSAQNLWRRRADGFALRHGAAFLEAALAGDETATAAAGNDLLNAGDEPAARRSQPPCWLEDLKHELEERSLASVGVEAHAQSAGAHPAHASRLFRQCYGASITEHAQAHSVRRAIEPLARADEPLGQIALAAGFYDQSHMTRVFRRVTGRTPGAHRALFAAAAG